MPSTNDLAIRLYRRFFGSSSAARAPQADAVLDGSSAVSYTESLICDSAALTLSTATQGAALTWRQQCKRTGQNSFGQPLSTLDAESAEGALAATIGQYLSGRRAAAFFAADELGDAQSLLRDAAERHLPLVAQLSTQTTNTLGSSHAELHQLADSGCFVMFAANVQEAVDFTLIAHQVAEQALVPGIVVMDGEQTALSAQELRLPSAELVTRYLGGADEKINAPTPAQQMLFGEQRIRLPRWHDLDQPMLQGSLKGIEVAAHGRAGGSVYFDAHVDDIIRQAFDGFAELTGRQYQTLSSYRTEDAKTLLLALGATVETARASADHLRKQHKMKVGVLGIRCHRPFPGAQLAEALKGANEVGVLERLDNPLGEETPLVRELRSALNRALDNGRFGKHAHPGYPAMEQRQLPRLHCGIYGIAGLHLRGADLIAWCRDLKSSSSSTRYIGLEFHSSDNSHPKRQVLLDRIRRAYPEIDKLGVRERVKHPILSPKGALTLKIYRTTESRAEALIGESASILQRLGGGRLRTQPGLSWDDRSQWVSDRLFRAPEGHGDCGRDTPVDVALTISCNNLGKAEMHWNLRKGGLLIVAGCEDEQKLQQGLNQASRSAIKQRKLSLLRLPTAPYEDDELRDAYILGGLFTALSNRELIEQNRRQVLSAWSSGLSTLDTDEQDRLSAAFEAGSEALAEVQLNDDDSVTGRPWQDQAPAIVQRMGSSSNTIESLARFWDQVGVLYRNGEQDDLSVDPFLATGSIPPLSSTFQDLSTNRTVLPGFHPENCTACGACWIACPDSAIAVTAVSPGALINNAVNAVGADALRPLASKLGARISAMARSGEFAGGVAQDAITQAWEWLRDKAQLTEERLVAVEAEIQSLLDNLGPLPLSVTQPLFNAGELRQKDGGELFSLVINPDACKGCGICTTSCQDIALTRDQQTPEIITGARSLWRTWQQAPDTASETITRLNREAGMDPMASLMMSRHCALAMTGGDTAEAGSGEKITLRQVLGATEYQQQPLHHSLTRELQETSDKLNELIRETLTNALPTDDLDRLSASLSANSTGEVDLGKLSQKGIEAQQMQRLVTLAKDLGDIRWRLAEGRYGLGRARYGLTIAAGSMARWAGTFPNNPFEAPVTVDTTGNAPQLAAGLLQSHVTETLHTLNLLRQAKAELDPRQNPQELSPLNWADLDEEQRRLCPPLYLVGSEEELGGKGFNQISWLINSDLPIKVLVLSELDMGLDQRGQRSQPLAPRKDPRNNLGLMALAQRNAYVAQSSIANPEHMQQCVQQGLTFPGPALIRIHAPSPARHGFATEQTVAQAKRAVEGRAFPLFRYNPGGDGVFGSRIDLGGNPLGKEAWCLDSDNQAITPADWALREARFSAHFTEVTDETPAPTEAGAWLLLEAAARKGKTPVITLGEQRHAISAELMEQAQQCQTAWRTLQELAGLVTPFTEMVNRDAEARVSTEHQAEMEALRAEYEEKLQALEARFKGDVADQIKGRLLNLAGYR
ncbi:MAG: 4Fe-4S binding protein [Candidatus Sedimenticola sp. 6PFRAG1]